MKLSLSNRILRIMVRDAAARSCKKTAFYLLLAEIPADERASCEINPDSFARSWRRHKKRL